MSVTRQIKFHSALGVLDTSAKYIGHLEHFSLAYYSPDGASASLEVSFLADASEWVAFCPAFVTGQVISNPPNGASLSTLRSHIRPLWIRATEEAAGTHNLVLNGSRQVGAGASGAAGGGAVAGVTGTAPITVDNSDPTNPIIGFDVDEDFSAGGVGPWTGLHTFQDTLVLHQSDDVQHSVVVAVSLDNTAASTNPIQAQDSPSLKFEGHFWDFSGDDPGDTSAGFYVRTSSAPLGYTSNCYSHQLIFTPYKTTDTDAYAEGNSLVMREETNDFGNGVMSFGMDAGPGIIFYPYSSGVLYFCGDLRSPSASARMVLTSDTWRPSADDTYDSGASSVRWKATYSKDLVISQPTSHSDGVGKVEIGNASTVPSTNAVGGGTLYAEGGALKWRGSGGTVTTVAPA